MWVREGIEEGRTEEFNRGALDMLAEVNLTFHLGETLRDTAQRRWWDILAMRMVLRG